MKNIKCAVVSVFVLFASVATAAPVGEWNFNLVPNGVASNVYANTNAGYRKARAQLFQDGSEYTFRLQGTGVDDCFLRELKSTVVRTEAVTTITPEPAMGACPRVRIVVKNDGTGGQLLVKIGKRNSDEWAEDENDYGLTKR